MLLSALGAHTSCERAPEPIPPVPTCTSWCTRAIPRPTTAPQVTLKPALAFPAPKGRQNHPGDNLPGEELGATAKELLQPLSCTLELANSSSLSRRGSRFFHFPTKVRWSWVWTVLNSSGATAALQLPGGSSGHLHPLAWPVLPQGTGRPGQPSDTLSFLTRTGTPGAGSYTPAARGNR